MLCVLLTGLLIPVVISVTNEGNLHLLEEEIAAAIRICTDDKQRQKRSNYSSKPSKIDSNVQQDKNVYDHERRNTNDTIEKIHILNITDYDYGAGNTSEKVPTDTVKESGNRTKRHDSLGNKGDSAQCLSQCVFANLQVVDVHGIPREAELWNIVQFSISSQQSRTVLRDQIRSCFQELESEAEDDGCSYSNKLERCLMLQFDDRKIGNQTTKPT